MFSGLRLFCEKARKSTLKAKLISAPSVLQLRLGKRSPQSELEIGGSIPRLSRPKHEGSVRHWRESCQRNVHQHHRPLLMAMRKREMLERFKMDGIEEADYIGCDDCDFQLEISAGSDLISP